MNIFKKPIEDFKEFEKFKLDVESIIKNIKDFAFEKDVLNLKKISKDFKFKTEDFFKQNRKLNVGVIGQVKAGKSSFLNSLLFDGKDILPKASTPKTANLTKIEYSDKNVIQIEYYSTDEWNAILDNAKVQLDDEIYTAARELVQMSKCIKIDPYEYTEKGVEKIDFENYEQLLESLNNYVGEDGSFTPFVKAVTIFTDEKNFKDISIVDTPGLNDPIISRTIRTKEFIQFCDVVFFLSQTGSFLDKSDWVLLSSQLPQKGVKKLVLIASKFDSGVRDVLRFKQTDDIFGEDENTADNIVSASLLVQKKLKRRAKEKIKEFVYDLENRGFSESLIDVLKECSEPLFSSSIAYNMSNKSIASYDMEEKNVFDSLSKFSQNINEDLKTLGNMTNIKGVFNDIVKHKEQILIEKAKSFVPTAISELKMQLIDFKEKAQKRLDVLIGNERTEIVSQKNKLEKLINGVRADITAVFGEINVKLESEKVVGVRELRSYSKEYSTITKKMGTRTKTTAYEVSASKWYDPFSWGKKETKHYTAEENYSYMLVSDVIENLKNYSIDSVNKVEAVFLDVFDAREVKSKLFKVIIENFDLSDEKNNSSLFRKIIEDSINKIEFPIIKIDISNVLNQINLQFNGEVVNPTEQANLLESLNNSIYIIFDEMSYKFERSVDDFKDDLTITGRNIERTLLKDINDEFEIILEKFENRQREIDKIKTYIKLLTKEIASLSNNKDEVKNNSLKDKDNEE